MQALIDTASSTFSTTIGFGWGNVTDFMLANAKLVLGSGLGLFQQLLPITIVFIIIGAIFYAVYRAFRFFRH